MKTKIALAVIVCLLILAQIIYTLSRRPEKAPPANGGQTTAYQAAQLPKADQTAPAPPAFDADGVDEIIVALTDGKVLVDLGKTTSGWTIANLYSAPADAEKVERFLRALLAKDREGTPPDLAVSDTGLGSEPGVVVKLKRRDGAAVGIRIGLSPGDRPDAVYARDDAGQDIYILSGDIRGELGLWRNQPGVEPKAGEWLQTRALAFDPARATALKAVYPDHKLEFSLSDGGEWILAGTAPGGEWNRESLAEWLAALADFRITDVAGTVDGGAAVMDSPSHRLEIALGETVKTVRACPNRGGDGMWVETSDFPGRVFLLPVWRFRLYFQRLESLFPNAVPRYEVDDILTLDVRRGGDSVKLIRRGDVWHAATPVHPLRQDRITRLAKILAGWNPEDYADPDGGTTRPAYGGPQVEVVLTGGDVYQYRLGGRHPVFPWRYVSVNGKVSLAAANAEATLMFPGFADIMDLGTVFPADAVDSVIALDFTAFEPVDAPLTAGDKKMALRKNADGVWEAEVDGLVATLTEDEVKNLVAAPLAWPVAGMFEQMARMPYPQPMHRLRVQTRDGAEHAITLLVPQARDIPFESDGERAFLIDRSDFANWLTALQDLKKRILDSADTPENIPDEPAPVTETAPDSGPTPPQPEEAPPPLTEEPVPPEKDATDETVTPSTREPAPEPLPTTEPESPSTPDLDENTPLAESPDADQPEAETVGPPAAENPESGADDSHSDAVRVTAVASEIEAPESPAPASEVIHDDAPDSGDPDESAAAVDADDGDEEELEENEEAAIGEKDDDPEN